MTIVVFMAMGKSQMITSKSLEKIIVLYNTLDHENAHVANTCKSLTFSAAILRFGYSLSG